MKCPTCSKFASYESEVEINSADVDDNGHVSIDGRVVLTAACCGDELKEWNFTLETDVDHEAKEGEDHEMEADCNEGEATEAKRGYIVTATANITCSCGFSTSVDLQDESPVSAFEELV